MNYYIQGNKEKADQIKAAFEKLGVASNANMYNYKNDYVLYFSAGGMMHMIDANGSWANIIKTHPDYQELELPVKPKFKVEDWLVYKNGNFFAGGLTEAQVVKVKDGVYSFASGSTGSWKFIDENCRLWTIQDAKEGDVLVTTKIRSCPFIYRKTNYNNNLAYYYAGIDGNGDFCEGCLKRTLCHFGSVSDVIPATKEQRDLLFAKMREAGYRWDAEKKELKKIQPHYDISNFKPFDHCRFKPTETHDWIYADFWYIQAHYKVEHLSAIEKWES